MDDFDALLTQELDRWHAAGRIADFWLRDDDAVEPTASLDRLLETTADFGIPLTLAVIPALTGEALARRLEQEPHCTVAVHGWAHVNHAGMTEKKQELGRHRPAPEVLEQLRQGLARLDELHPGRLAPVLVPPWNRIDADLVPQLGSLGYRALSVYGPEKPAELPLINTHVDVIDWHGTRGGRDALALAGETITRLRRMFEHGGAMGLLTHHLVHDAAVDDFLRRLFAITATHPACRWRPVMDILTDMDAARTDAAG